MSAEKKIDRLESAFADRNEASLTLIKLIGDHPRLGEISILIQHYGSRCADVVEAKAAYVAMEPTEPTEPAEAENASLRTELIVRISNAEARVNIRLDHIEGKFVAACREAYKGDQRLKVVESTLVASEDVRESWNASWTELMIRMSRIEEKFRAAEKEAAAETDGMSGGPAVERPGDAGEGIKPIV